MQINTPTKINPNYNINKKIVDTAINPPETVKPDDVNKGIRITPYIPVNICDNLIMQNVLLNTCIEVLSEDMVFNDITLQSENPNEDIINFWETNQDELKYQITDWNSYGFGASEIIYNTDANVAELKQIPANTLYISKEKHKTTGEWLFYAVQQVTGHDNVKMRLSHMLETYPPEDDNLPQCFWIGGGRKSDFFDYPCWISCFNNVSASVSLDMLDAQKLSDGNLISGILVIKRPPPLEDEELDDTLQEKMENHGSGVFTLELTSLNPDIPLTVDYVQISESNYQYLKELSEKCDSKILACFKIPKARLLIDDTTESMNSNKTNTLYKIYTNELNNRQRLLENNMRAFNTHYFQCNDKIEIETPVFIDDKEIEAQTITGLFNNGLITLGQAIEKIGLIFPEFNNTEFDATNPVYNERYYNGEPLGINSTSEEEQEIYNIGDYIDMEKINQVFSK